MLKLYTNTNNIKIFEKMSNYFIDKLCNKLLSYEFNFFNNKNLKYNQNNDISNINYITTLPLEDYNFNFDFTESPKIYQSINDYFNFK